MSLLTLPVESLREAQHQVDPSWARRARRERQRAALITAVFAGVFTAVAIWAH